jgi:hypothetical protein
MATKRVNIDIVAKDKSQQALNKVRGSLDGLKKSVFNVRNALAGLGGGLVIRSLVNTGKEIESLQVRLKFLFGTAEEGARAFEKMAEFASRVPFSLEEIQAGSGVLSVVSKDADELARIMEITGNVAAVTGLDFRTTAEQIQRSLSAGISSADLFRERGVKAMLGFSAGATVSVEETAEALNKIFGPGGKFGDATGELAKTFEGTLSMIGDKFFNFKREILEAGFFPELKNQFGDLDKFLQENQKTLDEMAETIGITLAISVKKLAEGLKFVHQNLDAFIVGIKVIIALKVARVFMGIATATLNIAKATIALAAGTSAIKKGFSGLVGMFAMGGIGYVAFQQIDKLFEDFLTKIDEAGSGRGFNSLGQQLNNLRVISNSTTSSLKNLNNETINNLEVFDIVEKAKEKLAKNENVFRAIKERGMSELELIRKRMNDELAIVEDSQKQLQIIRDQAIASGIMTEEMANTIYEQKMKDLEKIKTEIMKQGAKERLEIVNNELQQIKDKMEANYNEQFQIIKQGKFQELDLEKLTKDQKVQLTKDAGRELISQLAQNNRAMFVIDKALRIRQAYMNTAAGVTRALATGNIPLAAIIGGLGAVQIATIMRQQYQGRAGGGAVNKDQPYMVGEKGPEMFVPSGSGKIVPNNQMGNGQPVNVNFNINTVDARGFNELLVNSRGLIVNMINSAVNEKGRQAIV